MQYISAKTKNILVYKSNMFYWEGSYYPGLVDEETTALYDHPIDSFNKALGIPTSLDTGKIIPMQPQIATWADKLKIPEWFPKNPFKGISNPYVQVNCYA